MDREFGHIGSLRRWWLFGTLLLLVLGACADAAESESCADVVGVEWSAGGDATTAFAVTIRSDDTGWDGYADRWEVVANGAVIGERVLTHPHETEQPFTRSESGISVTTPEVTVRAHHTIGGFCGTTMVVRVG